MAPIVVGASIQTIRGCAMRRGILQHLTIVGCFGAASFVAPGAMAQNGYARATAEAPGRGNRYRRRHRISRIVSKAPRTPSANRSTITDSVFAEDIGKFPDLNIAESLNRIPGVIMTREVNGEGLNIAIRGLGTNFTKTVLNGAQIAVASSGRADSQNHESRSRPRSVPHRAVRATRRQQDARRRHARGRPLRHRQHAQRSGHSTIQAPISRIRCRATTAKSAGISARAVR